MSSSPFKKNIRLGQMTWWRVVSTADLTKLFTSTIFNSAMLVLQWKHFGLRESLGFCVSGETFRNGSNWDYLFPVALANLVFSLLVSFACSNWVWLNRVQRGIQQMEHSALMLYQTSAHYIIRNGCKQQLPRVSIRKMALHFIWPWIYDNNSFLTLFKQGGNNNTKQRRIYAHPFWVRHITARSALAPGQSKICLESIPRDNVQHSGMSITKKRLLNSKSQGELLSPTLRIWVGCAWQSPHFTQYIAALQRWGRY